MIEPRQIRAARALLNWSQTNLAEASGIAVSSIKNIENSLTVARRDTIEEIKKALEHAGVEFTLDGGVKPGRPEVHIFTGKDGFKNFFDMVYEEMRDKGGEIFVSGIDEDEIGRVLEGYGAVHIERMSKIKSKVNVKCLVKEGDRNFTAAEYCEYRWMPKEYFEKTHFYVFNDKVAIITILTDDDIYTVIHNIPQLAEFYKKLFMKFWNDAQSV